MRLRLALSVIVLLLLTTSMQALLFAQSSDCTGKAAQAQLSSIDPVYVDAMELARYLIEHGFIVKCVLASKEQNQFEDQKGAAFYRTDRGSFDVLFLPKTETFDGLEVVEQRQGARYLYSFRGTPKSPAVLCKNSIVASNPSQPLDRLLRRSTSRDRCLTETGRNRGTPASGRDEPDRGTNRRVLRRVRASRCRGRALATRRVWPLGIASFGWDQHECGHREISSGSACS